MIVCAPVRYATGLLKTREVKKASHPDRERIMTWDALEGELVTFNPDYKELQDGNKVVYHKKTRKASDFKNLQINIVAGDVMNFNGETWDGEQFEGVLSEESVIQLKPLAPYSKKSRDEVELIDLDENNLETKRQKVTK